MALPETLRKAINQLTLQHEFFASLFFEMKLVEVKERPKLIAGDDSIPFTMATDGRHIFYSRNFVDSITFPVATFALAHEVAHPMLMHLQRIYEHGISGPDWKPKADSTGRLVSRDPRIWNMAGDYVVNILLKNAGFSLWKNCLYDPRFDGMTTEQVYNLLIQEGASGQSSKSLAGCLTGADLAEPPAGTDMQAEAEEWKERIVRAAAAAKQRGHLPAGIEDLVKEYTEPVYPVWLLLDRYIDSFVHDEDYSWYRPHPTFMAQGVILPGAYSERVSHVSVWYDTSGSVSDEDLSRFHRVGGDIIRNAAPGLLTLGQCDAAVHSFTEIKHRTDWPSEIAVTGRGGTSFRPPFDYLRDRGISPSLMIYLTDLEGDFPTEPPLFPVLWVSTTPASAPFGTTIHLRESQ